MIVTAKISSIRKHPDAHSLKICEVTDGKETLEVVCGAQNAQKDMITIWAKVGSLLPDQRKISQGKLRGVVSHGMLCSALDLQISNESGIIDLPRDTKLGLEYQQLAPEKLSSTPWHQYRETEAFYWNEEQQSFIIIRSYQQESVNTDRLKLVSKSYFHDGQYIYRHFK